MIRPILRIELLKQRSLILSIVCIFATTILLAVLRQLVAHQDIAEGAAAIILLLILGAIPCLAVALPASAGAALRLNFNRSIDEALPFDPRSRLLGAYLVSLFHFVLISTLIVTAGIATGALKTAEQWLLEFETRRSIVLLVIFQAHLLAFVLSYISKQAIVGAASSVAICALQLSFLFMSVPSRVRWWNEFEQSEPAAFLIAFLFSVLFAAMVFFLSKKLQRDVRPGYAVILILFLFLFGGPIAVFAHVQWSAYRVENDLHPAFLPTWVYNPENESILKQGAIMTTLSGNVVRIRKDGSKIRLGEHVEYFEVAYGPDHSVWILTKGSSEHSYVLRKEKDGVLRDFSTFVSADVVPYRLIIRGSRVYLSGADAADRNFYAVLSDPGEQPVWKKGHFKDFLQLTFEGVIEAGQAAYASEDRTHLILKLPEGAVQKWSLPGTAQSVFPLNLNLYPAAYQSEKGPGFLLTVKDSQSRQKLIVCRPDGSIVEPWTNTTVNDLRVTHLPGGGAAALPWPRDVAYILNENGKPFPPLKVFPKASEENPFQVKRLANHHLWVIANGKFVRFDLRDGSHLVLAEKLTDWSMTSTEEGIYYTRKGEIWLLDWDGKERLITSAKLN